ncbi:MAG: hypothetical protein UZ05_CHB002001000 [Chlorobi bacterium OLB5]|nr:MAG: hypothetical protein UZ05_CHB002001000 [Chlorobi bacterium OLB5]
MKKDKNNEAVSDKKIKQVKARDFFRMRTDEEFEKMLDAAKKKSGLKNESEVIRLALNQYANN